jgi:hypothetical protein
VQPLLAEVAEFLVVDVVEFARQLPPILRGKPIEVVTPNFDWEFAEKQSACKCKVWIEESIIDDLHAHDSNELVENSTVFLLFR